MSAPSETQRIRAAVLFFGYLAAWFGLEAVGGEWLGGYALYGLEAAFAGFVAWYYRYRLAVRVPGAGETLTDGVLPLAGGFAVARLIGYAGIPVPVDLDSPAVLLLLLLVAPFLEEGVYRLGLWEPLSDLTGGRPGVVLAVTSLIFALAHLVAISGLPPEFRPFILVQALYALILGLAAGAARLRGNNLAAPVLVHFAFNCGFLLGV